MGKGWNDLFVGTARVSEPRNEQEDAIMQMTRANVYILTSLSKMLKNGDLRLEAPKGSRITADLLDALNERLPRALEIIAGTLMEE